ncbi:dihydrodipicolinate synthase family protein, partial [Candidatus Aerophobetes bacterium]|nr:dihydrodipicolinate synthase family protein [Candidatus Aerophobetes bacterium]
MEPEVTKGVWPVMLTPFKENGEVDWSGVDALTDWYIEAGVAGLFAVCLSSEMYELTEEEKISLVRRVVKRSAGKVPVVASGTFGGSIKRQAQFIKKLWEQGAKAAVVIVCQLARRDEEDDIWLQNVSRLLELTDEVPLGFYECPLPYHRLLTPEILRWAA